MNLKPQTTLYFIRHGQTASNADHIKQGVHINEYLDTTGILQMEHLAKLVSFLDLDILFTSYLYRAEESAAILNKHMKEPVPILHDYRLRERDFGSLSGKPEEEIQHLVPDWKRSEQMQMYDYHPFGGESVEDVRQRMVSSLLDMVQNYSNNSIGIITHGGIIRLILFHFPEISRIFHPGETGKDIANTDIYEWVVTDGKIANLKSLLK